MGSKNLYIFVFISKESLLSREHHLLQNSLCLYISLVKKLVFLWKVLFRLARRQLELKSCFFFSVGIFSGFLAVSFTCQRGQYSVRLYFCLINEAKYCVVFRYGVPCSWFVPRALSVTQQIKNLLQSLKTTEVCQNNSGARLKAFIEIRMSAMSCQRCLSKVAHWYKTTT